MGLAASGQRTATTRRLAAGAHRGAEVHDRLSVIRHLTGRGVLFGKFPKSVLDSTLSWPALDGMVARQHPFDVAVQDRMALSVRQGQDSASGGAADAG